MLLKFYNLRLLSILFIQGFQFLDFMIQKHIDKVISPKMFFSSQRQKVADEKNIARIRKEMMRLQQQMAVTQDEHNRISVINAAIREQLQGEQDKAFKMEESLKVYFYFIFAKLMENVFFLYLSS